ncbi:hypothetical protein [Cribrihabitans marinus]|uniref:hypothetical protein n=1 Tax=Cribrihabitans marinus TaxID=1227549 RepID=UPI0015A5657B|nr:hypothetical protein [Cribrihabitans marinus]
MTRQFCPLAQQRGRTPADRVPVRQDIRWNICAAGRKDLGFPALDALWTVLVSKYGEPA